MSQFFRVPGDKSAKVTWKNFPVIVLFVAFLIVITTAERDVRVKVIRVVAYAVYGAIGLGAAYVIYVFVRAIRRVRHARRVERLIGAGRSDEACELARSLADRRPRDWVTRINYVCTLHMAGRREEARQVLEGLDESAIPEAQQDVFLHWAQKLGCERPLKDAD